MPRCLKYDTPLALADGQRSLVQKSMATSQGLPGPETTPSQALAGGKRRRPSTASCTWCGSEITVYPVGRVPKWCSNSCRHRAWEQRRAAASGLASREPVERLVEVEVPVTITETVEVEVLPNGAAWAKALTQLADQIDRGRVYDRELVDIAPALEAALAALGRRTWSDDRRRRR